MGSKCITNVVIVVAMVVAHGCLKLRGSIRGFFITCILTFLHMKNLEKFKM